MTPKKNGVVTSTLSPLMNFQPLPTKLLFPTGSKFQLATGDHFHFCFHWWSFSFLFPLVIIFILFYPLVMIFIYFLMMIFQIVMIFVAISNLKLNVFGTSSLPYPHSSMVFHQKCNHIIRLKFAMLNNSKIFQEKGRHKSSAAQRLRHNHCPFALYKTLRVYIVCVF